MTELRPVGTGWSIVNNLGSAFRGASLDHLTHIEKVHLLGEDPEKFHAYMDYLERYPEAPYNIDLDYVEIVADLAKTATHQVTKTVTDPIIKFSPETGVSERGLSRDHQQGRKRKRTQNSTQFASLIPRIAPFHASNERIHSNPECRALN